MLHRAQTCLAALALFAMFSGCQQNSSTSTPPEKAKAAPTPAVSAKASAQARTQLAAGAAVKDPPLAPARQPPQTATLTAWAGGTLFDGTGADPVPNAVVLVEGDRIRAVGPASEVTIPATAARVDVKGRWLVPGLVDAHVHFFQSGGLHARPDVVDLRGVKPYADELAELKANTETTLRRYLASGITAVVDVGGPYWNFELRNRNKNNLFAPLIAVAGPLISTVSRPQLDLGDPPIVRAENPEAARKMVRKQLTHKPDLIKVWFIVNKDNPIPRGLALLKAVIAESHAAGVRVAVHATQLEAARASVLAGADVLVHSVWDTRVDDAFVRLLVDKRVLYVPTLLVVQGYAAVLGDGQSRIAAEVRFGDPAAAGSWQERAVLNDLVPRAGVARRTARWHKTRPLMNHNLKVLQDAGALIAAGTDAGNIGTLHGPSIHRELAAMVAAGMTPRQALVSATSVGARVFAEKPDFGTLTVGKRADMLVVDGDPLADIGRLADPWLVVKGGRPMVPEGILPPNAEWVVDRQIDAYNARDLPAFLGWYSDDIKLTGWPGGKVIARGRDDMRRIYGRMFARSPKLNCRVVHRITQGEVVIDHELVSGIGGKPYVRAIAVYRVRGDKIVQVMFMPR